MYYPGIHHVFRFRPDDVVQVMPCYVDDGGLDALTTISPEIGRIEPASETSWAYIKASEQAGILISFSLSFFHLPASSLPYHIHIHNAFLHRRRRPYLPRLLGYRHESEHAVH